MAQAVLDGTVPFVRAQVLTRLVGRIDPAGLAEAEDGLIVTAQLMDPPDRGCTRPPAFCDAHHLTARADGGATELGNLGALCRRHHVLWHLGKLTLEDLHVPWLTHPSGPAPPRPGPPPPPGGDDAAVSATLQT